MLGKWGLLILIGILLFSNKASGLDNLSFKYLNINNGLSNNHVSDVLEDSKGFLWFSTSYGLNKWDGYEMEIFKYELDNENSISSNFVLCLEEDHSGNIWIGTLSGIVRYNYSQKKFYRYSSSFDQDDKVPSTYIRRILVDKTDCVWIATNFGLCKYIPETDSFERIQFGPTKSKEQILNIYELSSGEVVFQTPFGLFQYNSSTRIFNKMEFPGLISLPSLNLSVVHLCFTSSNRLLIGSEMGLINYNLATHNYSIYKHNPQLKNSLSSNIISVIKEDSQHNIWIGTKDGGINLFQKATDDFQVFKSGSLNGKNLSNNIVTVIFEDSYKNIWIGTQEGGLTYFGGKEALFHHYENQPFDQHSLSNNKVSAFLQDEDGVIWVGTGNGGLNRFNQFDGTFDQVQFESEAVSPSILGMCSVGSKLYIVGWGFGFQQFDTQTKRFSEVKAKPGALPQKAPLNIKGLGTDSKGNIWLANHANDGIYIYNPHENVFYNAQNPGNFNSELLSVPFSVTMKQDLKGRIWIVSYTGLYLYDGTYHRFVTTPKNAETISSDYIYTLFIKSDSTIWIGSTNGLDKLIDTDGEFRFERCSQKYNLPDNVKAIQEDDEGTLWLSTNQGLTQFNTKTKTSRNFQFNDELPVQELFERSSLKAKNGELFFGSTSGFFKFNPKKIDKGNEIPKIYISDFQIYNESQIPGAPNSPLKVSITETDTLILTHKQSAISFEYVALDYNNQRSTEYAYILDGFSGNDKWSFVGNKRFASYTNLSPGEYTFRVRTASGRQLNEGSEASVKLIIKPPLWRTKWAYIVYLITFLFSLFLFQRSVIYREKLRTELRLEKMEMKNVRETSLMKLRFFTNISHEFRTPITLIKAPIEKLINNDKQLSDKERNYHYELILNSTNKLLNMVNQLLDYRKLEAGSLVLEPSMGDLVAFCRKIWENFSYLASQKQITYRFHTEMESLYFAFDADKLDKALSNLLSNAFKFTPAEGVIELQVQRANASELSNFVECIEISVKDSGIGIPEKDIEFIFDHFYMVSNEKNRAIPGSGIGLTLAKEMIELHKGRIIVQSKEGEGSEFTIYLPLNIEVLNKSNQIAVSETTAEEILPDESEADVHKLFETDVPTLLIVEDDEELQRFLVHELSLNYKILLAKNGEEGFQKAISELPNLILSDVMMPQMNGIELCRKIKSDERTSHMPVILITARYSQEKEIEGLESGADAYVLKPFNLQVLMLQISNLLFSRKELIEKFRTGTSLSFDESGIESKDQKLMQDIIDLIVENISNDKINAAFIADKLYISRSLLYIKLEALSGQTVNEFIRNIRLKKAVHMIENSDMTFTEVAYATGFTSQSYFSRSFAKQFGCSPTEYVKSKGG